jgi:hypothetical protein
MKPTFMCRRRNGNIVLTCRQTGDQWTIVQDKFVWRVYINGCYDTFRLTRLGAIERVESEARLTLSLGAFA